jgi:hypothetical protein
MKKPPSYHFVFLIIVLLFFPGKDDGNQQRILYIHYIGGRKGASEAFVVCQNEGVKIVPKTFL